MLLYNIIFIANLSTYCDFFSSNIAVFKQILSLVYTNDPNIISKLQYYDMDGFLDPIIIKGIHQPWLTINLIMLKSNCF